MRLAVDRFRSWFWRPPRAHGEIDPERSVSFLELFYDLVYVVVIAQAARHLATDISLGAAVEFSIVFALIWLAWLNGTLYYELHGREDGRTRTFVFLQMAILALLAVFTPDAAGAGGTAFATVYAAFLLVLTWLWYSVRRRDRPEFMEATARYLAAMIVSLVVIVISVFLPADARLVAWAGLVVGWIAFSAVIGRQSRRREVVGTRPTESMVERFDLLTIIVLGEVVTGVVAGLSAVAKEPLTLATGLCALFVGFGLWWIFFDFVGRRLPRDDGLMLNVWMVSHLPVTLAIAAAGASMVGLIEHANDGRTPPDIAWLLAGSVAVGLLALIVTAGTLEDYDRLAVVFRPVTHAMAGGAILAVVVGALQPPPWLLAFALVGILLGVWLFAVDRILRLDIHGPIRTKVADHGPEAGTRD
jgi:low temperature requirement protein LtrA